MREVPRFHHLELKELREMLSWEDSLMDDIDETVLAIQDTRPTIEVARTYHLLWRDISLPLFLSTFLDREAMDTSHITHVDISHNVIPSVPCELFQLPMLESLDLSHNRLTSLPPLDLWAQHLYLQFLKVSHNQLTGEGCNSSTNRPPSGGRVCSSLWYVDLSHNNFHGFPQFLLHFSLRHLDISHNEMVREMAENDFLWT